MPKEKDYYEMLGVAKTATADEIKAAYRKLVRKLHPDVNKAPDAQKKFTEVQHAYDILADEGKRKLYDQFGSAAFESGGPGTTAGQQQQQRGGSPHYSWGNVGGAGGGGFGVDPDTEDVGSVFEAIFGNRQGSPFGGGRAGGRSRRSRGEDFAQQPPEEVRQDISVDFMTAAKGGAQKVRVSEDGKAKTIEVTIPAGTEEGALMRVRGGTGRNATPDLILKVRITPHDIFHRGEGTDAGKGLDLTLDLPITIAEATLGATVSVPTLGSALELQVPPGTSSGKRLRLRGRGIHDPEGRKGDLYAVIKIVPPPGDALNDEQKDQLQAIAAQTPQVRSGSGWPARG